MTPSPTAEDREKARKIYLVGDDNCDYSCKLRENYVICQVHEEIAQALATTRQAAEEGQRERDAKVAEDNQDKEDGGIYTVGYNVACKSVALAIRATGGKGE